MNKKIKKALAVIIASLSTGVCAMTSGCGNNTRNDEQYLEIFVADFGYGTKWMSDMITLFKEQEYIKQKYPNLDVSLSKNSLETFTEDTIISRNTTIDLFFSTNSCFASIDQKENNKSAYEDLSDVYVAQIPGESVTVGEKMNPNFKANSVFRDKDGNEKMYTMPWVAGTMGLIYNKSLMEKYYGADFNLPLTTDQFSALADDIRKTKNNVPFMFSAEAGYWDSSMFLVWWAQYEGLTGYTNFWEGKDSFGDFSCEIFNQKGRVKSMEVMEDLIGYKTENGTEVTNSHSLVTELTYRQAQTRFKNGTGVFMPNGDWFQNEENVSDSSDCVITFMKTPVISSIVEKLQYRKDGAFMTDELLADVVKAVDEGKTEVEGVTASDFERIKDARSMAYPLGGHGAYIPEYSVAKGLAKDFLIFMATDKACESFMRSTGGSSLPFEYDVETKNPELYASLSQMHKDRIEIDKTATYFPNGLNYKLFYYGGVRYINRTTDVLEICFCATNPKDRKTPAQIFDADYEYYSKNDEQNWKSVLTNMGY